MNQKKTIEQLNMPLVKSILQRKTSNNNDLEDVLQEAYESYLKASDLGDVIEHATAWIIRVAQNKIIDRFRKGQNEKNYLENLKTTDTKLAKGPEEDWTSTWVREAIITAIEALPKEQREVFIKHELEGQSFQEMSQETGININTLLARKKYAIKSLRQQLKEIYDELE